METCFWSLFHLERNEYCSKFTINIEHSMNIFNCLKANVYWYPILSAYQRIFFFKSGVCFKQYFPDKYTNYRRFCILHTQRNATLGFNFESGGEYTLIMFFRSHSMYYVFMYLPVFVKVTDMLFYCFVSVFLCICYILSHYLILMFCY